VPVSPRPAAHELASALDWRGTERYEVLQCLGRGGMGAVYEVRDRESGQHLALKTLLKATPASLYLFKQEFRTLTDEDHPNLVRLHEFVMTGSDRVFFTMELVRGTDFTSYVRGSESRRESQRPALPAAATGLSGTRIVDGSNPAPAPDDSSLDAQAIAQGRIKRKAAADLDRLRAAMRQLVEGVVAIHASRKIHRDIKPSNVLVTPEGRVVILDFGVATEVSRVVDEEMRDEHEGAVGTAAYMAPEQAFEEPTSASDWYAVGVMLYETLVGRPPFTGSTFEVLTMKTSVDPLAPSECVENVPAELDALCRALLHREPGMRPTGPEILRRLGVVAAPRAEPAASGVMATADGTLPAALAGRESHLHALHAAFEATRGGRTVTVRVSGRSGMGKSAVVHRFLDELVRQGSAVVLRGRAYEREVVPYKAVDGVVDALSRYLMCLTDEDLSVALPKDTWALARLFPVLRRVPGIAALPEEAVTDPQRVRRRAFVALRELFSSLARRRPIVVFVDDAQWGDTDSASLLLELTRPPLAPPLLLAMTHREEEEQTSPFLRELEAHWPGQAEVRDLSVGPLELQQAHRLALSLVGSGDAAEATAEAIARESGGSPFLVEELARDVASQTRIRAQTPATPSRSSLEQMVCDRIERLPDEARRLLEIVAVSGRPVPTVLATEASDVRERPEELISLLRARRFVRAGLRGGREVLEIVHSRIRDAVIAQIPEARVRDHHERLVRALEARGDANVAVLVTHLFGAGRGERAAQFAERAAEEAAAKLAFDQAAHLLRLTIDALPPSSADGVRLRKRLGELLEWAGRSAEAGRVYLDAATRASGLQKVDLQRAAAEQLHASGLMDEGTRVLHDVLAATGTRAPRSGFRALLWLLAYRLWLRLAGVRFRERGVRPEVRMRLDALYAVALGFSLVDHIVATAMKTRVLVAALRAGDRLHAARASALVASDLSGNGGPVTPTARALLALAQDLAKREPDPSARTTVLIARGIACLQRGEFKEAKAALDPIQAAMTNRRIGQQSALLFTLSSMHLLGELKELSERHTRVLAEADERGNRFVSVAVRTSTAAAVWLAADDPARARRELSEAMAQWAQAKFSNQAWRATMYGAEIDLYVGDFEGAYQRVEGLERALNRNFFLFVHYVRALTAFIRGRAAAASAAASMSPALRRARLAEARRCARKLERESMPWSTALASIVRAALAHSAGDRAGTLAALRTAMDGAGEANMALHAAAARHELGLLIGGEEGGALVCEAEETMKTRGVVVPSRYAAMLVPGLRVDLQQ
jgi:eukaryotic-like serine/threonine-protein kinase